MTTIDAIRVASVLPLSQSPRLLMLRMTVMIMMLMTMMPISSALGDQKSCSQCRCYVETGLIDCRGLGLTGVPSFQPSNVTYDNLLLSNNRIRRIGAAAFNGIRFRKLEIIDNPLMSVDAAAFAGLESTLTEVVLELHESSGAEFPDRALRTLVNLTTLKVADYANSSLPIGALIGLRTLRELRLTPGSLETLSAADLLDQSSSLQILDVSDNKLRQFPTDAIQTLSALRVLNVRANLFDHLAAGSIISSSLEELDVSQNALNRDGINSSALSGVASTLRRLVISQCHLNDRHAPALTRAGDALVDLVISFNHLTSVRPLLADLTGLERLDAQNNSVDELTPTSLPSTRRLRALNLAYNPLKRIDPDAFHGLRGLEDLKLDYARAALPLRCFASQRWTLRNLSLRGVDLSRLQWSVVSGLERLEMLSLSRCHLGNIPPFTFRGGSHLHTLELASNHIDQLNQRALVGLESSLVRLNLDSNRLTTVDRCAFHGFTALDAKSLILRNNSLRCDCRLHWLYNWTDQDGSRFFLNWRCADGRPFSTLTDRDFQHCEDHDDDEPCEDFTLTTSAPPRPPVLRLFVVNVTSTSFTVRWTVATSSSALLTSTTLGFLVNCSCADTWRSVRGDTVREQGFDGLSASTKYRVCVMLDTDVNSTTSDKAMMMSTAVSCLNVTTKTWLSDPVVMWAVIVGATLVFVVLLLVVCLSVRRLRRSRRARLAELAQPKIAAGRTKRFQRQQQRTTQSLDALAAEPRRTYYSRSVEMNLDTLHHQDVDADTYDDRYRTLLALRLLQSRNARSLDDLVDGVNAACTAPAPSYFMNQLYARRRDAVEQEIYDEIDETEVSGCKSPLSTDNTDLRD